MRYSNNIFENDSHRGGGRPSLSGAAITAIILGVISVLAAIFIIVNFDAVTAQIAVWAAEALSSGAMILITILVILYLVMKLKWKMRRFFWGW